MMTMMLMIYTLCVYVCVLCADLVVVEKSSMDHIKKELEDKSPNKGVIYRKGKHMHAPLYSQVYLCPICDSDGIHTHSLMRTTALLVMVMVMVMAVLVFLLRYLLRF